MDQNRIDSPPVRYLQNPPKITPIPTINSWIPFRNQFTLDMAKPLPTEAPISTENPQRSPNSQQPTAYCEINIAPEVSFCPPSITVTVSVPSSGPPGHPPTLAKLVPMSPHHHPNPFISAAPCTPHLSLLSCTLLYLQYENPPDAPTAGKLHALTLLTCSSLSA